MTAAPSTVPDRKRFNHTIKYQRELFRDHLPAEGTALDVGCGEGLAAREMAAAGLAVTAVDMDPASLERARAQATERITYVEDDFLAADLGGPFDVVYAGAVLHHVDLLTGLERLRSLVAPGGVLLVVGLAMSRWPRDFPFEMAASVASAAWSLARGSWDHQSPTVWPPPHSYEDVLRATDALLPGAQYTRHLLWRYTIVWRRPEDAD